jgi:chromosome segregation ATPase
MDQDDLRAYLEERFARVDQQFAQVNQRFTQMDQQFAQVDQRFTQMDQRFTQMDQRFTQMDQRFTQMDQRFNQMDQRFNQMDQRFTQMDQQFAKIDQRFAGLEEEVHKTRIITEGLDDKIRQLADGVVANTEKLESFRDFISHRLLESETFQCDLHRDLREPHIKLEARVTRLEAAKRKALRAPKGERPR